MLSGSIERFANGLIDGEKHRHGCDRGVLQIVDANTGTKGSGCCSLRFYSTEDEGSNWEEGTMKYKKEEGKAN